MYKYRQNRLATVIFTLTAALVGIICAVCFIEYRLVPILSDTAVSRARILATELINKAVTESLTESPPIVRLSAGENGIAGVETDIAAISKLRAKAVETVTRELKNTENVSISVPIGNLFGSTLMAGRGFPVKIRLVPIGDISADVRTEFIESGINQTLHKIVMRVRMTVNVLVSNKPVKLELASDISLAETVIVGKVPDAYTAINRFEIDEDEENDLNDYAATLP